MIAVLHLGKFDGAEFDMRPWMRVPGKVYARHGGDGPLGMMLSQDPQPGAICYRLAVARDDSEYHYCADEDLSGYHLTVEDILRAPVKEAA